MCDEKAMRDIFDQFDNDKSGTIDQKELKTVLKAYFEAVGEANDDERVEQAATDIMAKLDISGDGQISFDEFVTAFN